MVDYNNIKEYSSLKEVEQMKLSDKIQLLRKIYGYSQEQLAELCNVSRQAISKWEMDISLPDVDKIILLSKLFNTSIDVLLKDDLEISYVKENHSCSTLTESNKVQSLYTGIIIKESLEDELVLDYVYVNKVELWKTKSTPKYWTAVYFTSNDENLPDLLSKSLIADSTKGGNWFIDLKIRNTKIIVFKNKILKYEIGNSKQKDYVCNECRKLGISDNEMNWEE